MHQGRVYLQAIANRGEIMMDTRRLVWFPPGDPISWRMGGAEHSAKVIEHLQQIRWRITPLPFSRETTGNMLRRHLNSNTRCSTLRLYEYLATGRAIVSYEPRTAQIARYGVRIGRTHGEFVACIDDVLNNDTPEQHARRLLLAKATSRGARVRQIARILEGQRIVGR